MMHRTTLIKQELGEWILERLAREVRNYGVRLISIFLVINTEYINLVHHTEQQ